MPSPRIPRDIRHFVARFLPTVEHLETFILLCSNATRWWSASDIAELAGIDESAVANVLEELGSANFLDVKISNDILYRFNPAKTEIEELSKRCAEFCAHNRIALINLVAAGTMGAMHDFAEAFRLKKKGRKNG